jgi:hypothetical protein
VDMSILSMEQIESGPVVDSEVLRLSLVGWDVPAFCAPFPVLSGVSR